MVSLRDTQHAFAQALTNPFAPQAAALVAGGSIPAERRLQIYRNNVLVSLGGALEAVFPVTRRLLGEGFFGHVATRYSADVPSLAGDIHAYGGTFPDYLAALPESAELPYLPDVARLEWAHHVAFHAADALPLGLASLAQIPPNDWPRLRLSLVPASALLRSAYPTLRIWQINQDDSTEDAIVRLDEGGNDVLVLRQGEDVASIALWAGEMEFLGAIALGSSLSGAVEVARDAQAEFDLGASLTKHLHLGTFAEKFLF